MVKTGKLTRTWLKAKQLVESKQLEEAEQMLDLGILYLTFLSEKGWKDKDLIEGVKMSTWYERFWISIENNIWPTKPEYEKDYKMS